MTNEERDKTIAQIERIQKNLGSIGETVDYLDFAIEALEQQQNRCDSCVHSEEQDGSNCYECVKGMTDNFETQPTDADCISRESVYELLAKEDWADTVIGIKELPSVTPQQTRWIPVSERLPEHKGDFLVTFKLLFAYPVEVCYFDGQAWDKGQYDAVLAWMPLPEPYKVESEK